MGGIVVIVGSLNADLVVKTERFPQPGETLHGSDLAVLPGGKSANQAVAAARLGGSVRMVGAVGDDSNGAMLRRSVADAGVDIGGIAVRESTPTGTAVITVDSSGENTIVVSAGANGTLSPLDLPDEMFDGAAVLGLCLEVGLDVVLEAARRAAAAGVTVLTNLSPFGEVPEELLSLTDVLLVNEHEAAALGEHQVRRAIVTRGADGSRVYDGDRPPVDVPAIPVTAVDTTGCGDAFMGAVAVGIASGATLADAAVTAAVVGAYAATRHGAQSSYPTVDELTAFRNSGG